MTTTTNISSYISEQLKIYEDPYLKVRVDVRDNANQIVENINGWTQGGTDAFNTLGPTSRIDQWIGYNTTPKYGTLTRTITLPYSGYYLIDIFAIFNSCDVATFQLYCDGRAVEDLKSVNDKYYHASHFTYKPKYFRKGSHTFKFDFYDWGWISEMTITPIIRFEGDSLDNQYKKNQNLNVRTCEWTRNSVSEMNQLTLTTDMQENYWDYESNISKPVVFDWMDHITLWAGEDLNSTEIMFGGYSFPSSISPDGVLELKAVDRMFDLQRTNVKSSSMGTTAQVGNGAFPSIYELARYLASACFYRVNTYGVPYDYGFYHDFSTTTDFDSVTVTGWTKTHDIDTVVADAIVPGFGSPAPSMKLTYTGASTPATCQLFLNLEQPYDAAIYDKFNLSYYYASGTTTPYPFNIHIKMYMDGYTVGDAAEYILHFTGGTETIELANVACGIGGVWNTINVNLKSLFNALFGSSPHYYITDIHLSGTIVTGAPLWIDQVMAYRDLSTAPSYSSTDLTTYLDVLKDLCEKTDHASYIIPGESRAEDALVMLPQNSFVNVTDVDESNLVEFGGWTSDPQSDGFYNWGTGTYTDAGGTEYNRNNYNMDSVYKYGDTIETISLDVKTQAEADNQLAINVANNSYPNYGFTLKTRGLADLMPLQNLHVDLRKWNIFGDYPTKSTTYSYDREGNPHFTTSIDLNRPSKRFRNWIRSTRSDVRLLNSRSVPLGLYSIGV
jgi:hypothetical protein